MNDALPRLLQLASPALPVGAYTYSQGLEWAVEVGWLHDPATVERWITGLLVECLGCYEAPLLARLQRAWAVDDRPEVERLNDDFLASRETSELRAETVQMGYSLRRLLQELDDFPLPAALEAIDALSFPAAWALAASGWHIPLADSVGGYLWSWAENQVMAAVKTVPLGQTAGQRLLLAIGGRIPAVVQQSLVRPEVEWSNVAPGLALASSGHEAQYSRLFRS